jgi:hypothetical protein
MRHIVTSFVAPLSPPHFSTLSPTRCDFRKKVAEHKICVLIFSTTFVTLLYGCVTRIIKKKKKKSLATNSYCDYQSYNNYERVYVCRTLNWYLQKKKSLCSFLSIFMFLTLLSFVFTVPTHQIFTCNSKRHHYTLHTDNIPPIVVVVVIIIIYI